MLFSDGDKIIFTGDSVTDAGRGRPVGEGLHAGVGGGYVRQIDNILNVVYPDWRFWVVNTGSSGDTSRTLKARWQEDVMNLKPDWVSLMIGVNDVWRQFDSPGVIGAQVSLTEYTATLCELLERTLPAVKGMILISPFYMEPLRDDPMRRMVCDYARAAENAAKKYNCLYVNVQQAFDDFLNYRHSSYISWDRVHPGPIGSTIIAREFLKAVGMDRQFI